MPQGEGAVYVYGILSSSARRAASTAGVKNADVRVVRCGGLAALVSDLEADALAAAREVRAHWRVLEAAADDGTTVLPVRFGTVMEGDRAVREQLLEPHEDDLVALLEDLEGRVQLSVKGEYDEERLMADVVRTSPSIAARRRRLRTLPPDASYYERIALGEMVAAEVERRRQDDAGLVLGRLEPLAVSARTEPPAGANGAFNLAFLVERDRMAAFGRAVAKLGEELGDLVALRYIGPLPPYSFVDAELTAGSAGWA